ncbi:hypothetical protein UFOVP225_59 [uncultured Caudovirales phage]|uniref:Uncharacterized protein n=1 Tax=uncultured Caudovirales phage TaxID=2100421 RepID=A0A6J7WT83_9CAUD|nr:hypothetical protein UFOVP113_72 [uncultured Caudovirales phage]CAB5219354.1 hypothetical protein UFOVP225_59 [uncultured Caudovirales phage]
MEPKDSPFSKIVNFTRRRAQKRDEQISQSTPFGPMDNRTPNRIKHQEVKNLEEQAKKEEQ